MKNFTNIYPQSKTLKFELRPQGATLDNIHKSGLIDQDETLKADYQAVKKMIDEYHKVVIDESLTNFKLTGLPAYEELYYKDRTEAEDKTFEKIQSNLRKQVHKAFGENKRYKSIFKKELIQKDLPAFVNKEEEREQISRFYHFTTYFTGFHENRKNIYTAEAKATSVCNRLIHENLPKFLDNRKTYLNYISNFGDLDMSQAEEDLQEVLGGIKVGELFSLDFFNHTLTQQDIDIYNIALGGRSVEGGKKIQGINECINLYRQNNQLKARQLPNIKPLYKQILSESESGSFLLDKFEKDEDLFDGLRNFYQGLNSFNYKGEQDKSTFIELMNLFGRFSESDMTRVYLRNDASLSRLSKKLFGDWSLIVSALRYYYDAEVNPLMGKKATNKYIKEKENWLNKSRDFSIDIINKSLLRYGTINETVNSQFTDDIIFEHFSSFMIEEKNLLNTVAENFMLVSEVLSRGSLDNDQNKKKKEIKTIKTFLDNILDLLHFIKPLSVQHVGAEKDEGFYSDFDVLYDQLSQVIPLYSKTRYYLTKKPYSVAKFKMNFKNNTLLDGWDVNKETANKGVLLQKEGLFYLAIMNKDHSKSFYNIMDTGDTTGYQKMDYKLLPGPNKMLPKVFFSVKNLGFFNPSEKVLRIRNTSSHSKNGNPQEGFDKADFSLNDCHSLIDFFKASLDKHADWKKFAFDFSPTQSYNDISEFYREVENQGYKITYTNISDEYIHELVNEGKIYLFQIYNKDFSPFSKGKPNLHTLYWRALFDEKNLEDVVYKLNGQAEVFYRKKSIEYSEEKWIQGHHYDQLKDRFAYPIIKDKRFAFDKFQFHVPITMNFKASGSPVINMKVREYLKTNPDVKIIGLDRGERHLLYLTLIDQNGNIEEQYSLNEIVNSYNGKVHKKDYQQLLHEKEGDRKKARENWETIETIKELKEGYLSHVVHKIVNMMVEHNAIVVMEDLNFGFKRGRFHVEKQIYQKFEKMLIDKLNYLVLKDTQDPKAPTGLLNALQLSNKFESFQKLGKQSGFVFYLPAYLTSKIDPATGFVNQLRIKYDSVVKSQAYYRQFDRIVYNTTTDWFEFGFRYVNFGNTTPSVRQEPWTICTTHHPRYAWNKNSNMGKGGTEEYNITEELKKLFDHHNIAYEEGTDLIESIASNTGTEFFKRLNKLLNVTASLRHNNGKKGKEERDFILSPVANSEGAFFNSLEADETQPENADANGAYHIALKGLWALQSIRKTDTDRMAKLNLVVSNEEWLNFAQAKQYRSQSSS